MAGPFLTIRYHKDREPAEVQGMLGPPSTVRGGDILGAMPSIAEFENDEAAARFYLGKILGMDKRRSVRSLAAAEQPQAVPDLRLLASRPQRLTNTSLVRFEQVQNSVPVFGSQAVVELSADRGLVSVDAELAEIKHVSQIASTTPAQALESIAALTGGDAKTWNVAAPVLTFFHDDKTKSWHLAWFVKEVPAAPAKFLKEAAAHKRHPRPAPAAPATPAKGKNKAWKEQPVAGHGLGFSPRELAPALNYLVDAHDNKVLFYYSAAPMLTLCHGIDEEQMDQEFYALEVSKSFEMCDTLRGIKTYDLSGKDITDTKAFPRNPIRNTTGDWQQTNTAAVSAHVNAMKVYDFYKDVLKRDSIDDNGMEIVSVVNCTYSAHEPPPAWHNAVWYKNRMWYGQSNDDKGKPCSYSRYIDVIGHELTHGVTQSTAKLVYKDQSGALNESFSDIFGVIIHNWDPAKPKAMAAKWNWEIGTGLGGNGLPLRDLRDPNRTGDPDHMKDYDPTDEDSGGVHTNSNIHNKAAYYVFTAKQNGKYVFRARDVAILYYLCLCRLNPLATFSKTLQVIVDVATTYFAANPKRDDFVKHIRDAYEKVGVT